MSGEEAEAGNPAETLRALERTRVRLLVDRAVDAARPLHAPTFELVNPRGEVLSREQYLGDLASGRLRYLLWEPGPISVQLVSEVAVLRYRSTLQIVVAGETAPCQDYWHLDVYTRLSGAWQVMCSQATGIRGTAVVSAGDP